MVLGQIGSIMDGVLSSHLQLINYKTERERVCPRRECLGEVLEQLRAPNEELSHSRRHCIVVVVRDENAPEGGRMVFLMTRYRKKNVF